MFEDHLHPGIDVDTSGFHGRAELKACVCVGMCV